MQFTDPMDTSALEFELFNRPAPGSVPVMPPPPPRAPVEFELVPRSVPVAAAPPEQSRKRQRTAADLDAEDNAMIARLQGPSANSRSNEPVPDRTIERDAKLQSQNIEARERLLGKLMKHKLMNDASGVTVVSHISFCMMRIVNLTTCSIRQLEDVLHSCNIFVSDVSFICQAANPVTTIQFSARPPPHDHCRDMVTRTPAQLAIGEKVPITSQRFSEFCKTNPVLLGQWQTAINECQIKYGAQKEGHVLKFEDEMLGTILGAVKLILESGSCPSSLLKSKSDQKETATIIPVRLTYDRSKLCYCMSFEINGGQTLRFFALRRLHDVLPFHVRQIDVSNNKEARQLDVFIQPYTQPLLNPLQFGVQFV